MEARTYRWAEAWLGGYWVITAIILILGPGTSSASVKLAVMQLGAAVALYVFSSWVDRHPDWAKLYWVPWIPCFIWTYSSIDMVQKVLAKPLHDGQVQGWEKAIWGSFSPAMEWSQLWPWLLFSEFLHFCYVTYYFMMPVLLIRLLRRDRDDLARLALCGGVSSLVASYLITIYFPVQGPRPLYPALAAALHGPIWTGCHAMLHKAAAAAAAFPSGHTSLAVATACLGWSWDRKWTPLYAIWALGVMAATVYGRFHYTVDVFAGILVGVLCAASVLYSDPDSH
jgi:membrane-associated phospholipid phosphatase